MLQKRTKYKKVAFFQEMGEKGVFENKTLLGIQKTIMEYLNRKENRGQNLRGRYFLIINVYLILQAMANQCKLCGRLITVPKDIRS